MHDGSDRKVGRAAEEQHDHHTEYDGSLAELALGGAAETEIVTAARLCVFTLVFPSAHVGCDGCPGSEPEKDGEGVEGGRGVDVGEAGGAGPHGRHDKVDQNWDGEPALEGWLALAVDCGMLKGLLTSAKNQPVRPSDGPLAT